METNNHKHISLEMAIIAITSTGVYRLLDGDIVGLVFVGVAMLLDWIKHKEVPWR